MKPELVAAIAAAIVVLVREVGRFMERRDRRLQRVRTRSDDEQRPDV